MSGRPGRRWARGAAALAIPVLGVGAILAPLAACDRGGASSSTGGTRDARRAPDDTYTVRGRIVQLPVAGKPMTDLRVHHEAIPTFRKDGEVVGMNEMIMHFPPAEGLRLDGFAIGDPVELTFAVWWGADQGWEATSMRKLPPETVLEFERPAEPGAAPVVPPAPEPGADAPKGG